MKRHRHRRRNGISLRLGLQSLQHPVIQKTVSLIFFRYLWYFCPILNIFFSIHYSYKNDQRICVVKNLLPQPSLCYCCTTQRNNSALNSKYLVNSKFLMHFHSKVFAHVSRTEQVLRWLLVQMVCSKWSPFARKKLLTFTFIHSFIQNEIRMNSEWIPNVRWSFIVLYWSKNIGQ